MSTSTALDCEGYCPSDGNPFWNQSIYFNFYDPKADVGAFVRFGILEGRQETNMWFIFFRAGKPLYTRLNMNLPYTTDRLADGVTLAGVSLKSTGRLTSAQLRFDEPGFKAEIDFSEILPMVDAITVSQSGADDGFANEMSHVHMEGVSRATGTLTLGTGEVIAIDGKGFRDIAVGPRNWDYMEHYRLAWPVFDNGVAIGAVHGIPKDGPDSWMRMVGRDGKWTPVTDVRDDNTYEDDGITLKAMHWVVTAADGTVYDFTGRSLFRWTFPFDSFVVTEHMMAYTLADGTKGYGLGECGFRLI